MQAFVKARPAVLGFAREGGRASTPKRRRDELGEEDQDEEEEEMPRKRTRASTKRQPTQSSQRVVVIDSEDDIDEYIPGMYRPLLLLCSKHPNLNRRLRKLSHLQQPSKRNPYKHPSR